MATIGYVTNAPFNQGETRTYENFLHFLGDKPKNLGLLSRLYPQCTATYYTEALGNIFYNSSKKANRFQSIDSYMIEWQLDVNEIKRIPLAAVPEGDGADGTEITFYFPQRYYEKYDIFKIEDTRQQFIVVSHPIKKANNLWVVQARIVSEDYNTMIDMAGAYQGSLTVFQSNAVPELSEEGYVKTQSNIQKIRNYLTTFRNDIDYSSQFEIMEDKFIRIAKGDNNTTYYQLDKKEKILLDNFMLARSKGLLLNRSNIDPRTGKPNIVDPSTGRPIYIGAGIIPQIERFASKSVYYKFTLQTLNTALAALNRKAEKPQGNHYNMVVNEALYTQIQQALGDYLAKFHTDGTFLYSMQANGYVKVNPNGYDTYNYMGNSITFTLDRALTEEFGDKGYGIIVDLTSGSESGTPAVSMFTVDNKQFIENTVNGVGGKKSGEVASRVAGSTKVIMGIAGVAVFNPYRSYILRQA